MIFILFFLIRKPHDCFECLSVNANLKISIFQYTNKEVKAREEPVENLMLLSQRSSDLRPSDNLNQSVEEVDDELVYRLGGSMPVGSLES